MTHVMTEGNIGARDAVRQRGLREPGCITSGKSRKRIAWHVLCPCQTTSFDAVTRATIFFTRFAAARQAQLQGVVTISRGRFGFVCYDSVQDTSISHTTHNMSRKYAFLEGLCAV
jgi:hypothetical protein